MRSIIILLPSGLYSICTYKMISFVGKTRNNKTVTAVTTPQRFAQMGNGKSVHLVNDLYPKQRSSTPKTKIHIQCNKFDVLHRGKNQLCDTVGVNITSGSCEFHSVRNTNGRRLRANDSLEVDTLWFYCSLFYSSLHWNWVCECFICLTQLEALRNYLFRAAPLMQWHLI